MNHLIILIVVSYVNYTHSRIIPAQPGRKNCLSDLAENDGFTFANFDLKSGHVDHTKNYWQFDVRFN